MEALQHVQAAEVLVTQHAAVLQIASILGYCSTTKTSGQSVRNVWWEQPYSRGRTLSRQIMKPVKLLSRCGECLLCCFKAPWWTKVVPSITRHGEAFTFGRYRQASKAQFTGACGRMHCARGSMKSATQSRCLLYINHDLSRCCSTD